MSLPPRRRLHSRSLLVFSLLAAAAARAFGQGEASPAGEPALTRIQWGSFTVYSENDKYFAGTDRRYSNGLKLTALSTNLRAFDSDIVPGPVRWLSRSLSRFVARDEIPKLGLSLGQQIYTPENTSTPVYLPADRPYAAWLYGSVAFHNSRSSLDAYGDARTPRLDVLEVCFGVVGPWALGRQVQNGFHDLINAEHAQGWDNQIKNEPGLNLVFERKWRLRTGKINDTWAAEVIPHLGFSLGNVFTYANTGFEVRAGYRLPQDFGSSLIRPTGDSNSLLRAPLSVFVFGQVDGRAVARDITLDGNTFRDSPSIDAERLVADLTGGVGVGGRRWQAVYTQALRTREFQGQPDNQVFGSVSLTVFF